MYTGYKSLYDDEELKGKFEVIAFPCNQFGGQEPGTHEEIKKFAVEKYQFPGVITEKVNVNGGDAHPAWEYMQNKLPGILGTTSIKWNFSKFLVGPDGKLIKRYGPKDAVKSIKPDLLEAVSK
eukprot:TRINITY_DN5883_c0_g1_i1.p1 TRINITY_DN5883_c0_g1~~TRINITY_DN5883_c0_g1_i1.p1  ORF type:complete len:123 (+),score=21.01 TRINITY_DN5883_c0_g1_i1:262-630(+)